MELGGIALLVMCRICACCIRVCVCVHVACACCVTVCECVSCARYVHVKEVLLFIVYAVKPLFLNSGQPLYNEQLRTSNSCVY